MMSDFAPASCHESSCMRKLPLVSLAVLILFAAVVTAGRPLRAETRDETLLRPVLQGYLDAFSRKDSRGASRYVTDNEKQRQDMWAYLEAEFEDRSEIVFTLDRFRVREIDEETALARTLVRWKFKTAGDAEESGLQTFDLLFSREIGVWKLYAFRFSERHLYQAFMAAKTPEERAKLLKADPEIAEGWLPLSLRNDALALSDAGKAEEAEPLADLALEASEVMDDDYERGYSYLTRGHIRHKQGRHNASLGDNEKARQIFEKLGNKDGLAKVWRNSGHTYTAAGEYPKAVKAYLRALEQFREIKDEEYEAGVLHSLGNAYHYSGNGTDALTHLEAALTIQRRRKNRLAEAEIIGSIAAVYQDQERYAEALEGYETSRRIHQEIGSRSAESALLTNIGNLYLTLGRIAEAEVALKAAVRVSEETRNNGDLLIALHNLCRFFIEQRRLDEAMETGYRCAELSHKTKDARFWPQMWSNLGDVCYQREDWPQARWAYSEMLECSRDYGNRTMESIAVLGLAMVDHRENRWDDARRRYREARTLAERAGSSSALQRALYLEGTLHESFRDWSAAADCFRKSAEAVERVRAQTRARALQTSYLRQYAYLYHRLADCYARLWEPEQAFAVSEQVKGRSLVDVIQTGMVRVTRAMTPEQRKHEEELEGRLVQLTSTIEKTVLTDTLTRLTEERDRTRAELQAFQDQLYVQHPQLRTQRAEFAPATPHEVIRKLLDRSPKSVILSYMALDRGMLLFILHRGERGETQFAMRLIPVKRGELLRRVADLWQGCSAAGGRYEEAARWLFRTLIQPAARELAGKDHLILIPDPDLATLPFAALLDERATPLVAKYALSYAPSATALLKMAELAPKRAAPGKTIPLLAFGNPVMPPRLPELPETQAEVAALARLFGPSAVTLTGPDAQETRAKSLLGRAKLVHFATHGTLDQDQPMYSAIVLTRDDRNDGFLQARELSEMDLAADLVVLSACETALGQKVRGEGVVGLAWALFVGGASSTVASQWQVADESTRTLMTAFYQRLLKPYPGAPDTRAEALRHAQLALIRGKKYAHPYYWAAFGLMGQWRGR
jgi:CHAT domain-containing protein/tetratricopeptide (TPR) repeat protein